MKKLSIIVPVYNTEKYIKKCLESLAKQKMQDFEIIIVNDGSPDNSEEIVKKFIEENNNLDITYLKKENSGLSDSRNLAVKKAKGKYISFIDSDDYINVNLYKNLKKYMDEEIDLIKFKMQTINEKGELIKKIDGPVFNKCTGEEALEKLCGIDNFLEVACIYLYKKEFFINNNFKYASGKYHEDFGLTPLVIAKAKSVVSSNEFGYYYLQTDNSLTRDIKYEKTIIRCYDVLEQGRNAIQEIEKYEVSKKTKDLVKRYYTNSIIIKAKELKDKEQKEYIKEIRKQELYKNIKPYNIKQLIKRTVLKMSVKTYLKMR